MALTGGIGVFDWKRQHITLPGFVKTLSGPHLPSVLSPKEERDHIAPEKAEEDKIANLDCGRILKAYNYSWRLYLESNPAVAAWADKYLLMAEKERMKQGAID